MILMLGALSVVTPFSIDMYLPAFPEIAIDLRTSLAKVSFSVASYFFGFALGQIFYGPLLDRFGRKRPLYAGLILYILASVGCLVSGHITSLLASRFIQAFGGCVASVAATAMVRDFFPVKEGAKVFSLLILILGVSPLLAPTVGGFVVTAWGWRWVFGLLAIIVLLILIIVFFFLPEGQAPDRSVSLGFRPVVESFRVIFQEPRFCTYAFAGSFSMAGLFVYVAGSPAIFMESFHVSAKMYGGIFAFLSVGFIGGSQLNHVLTRKYDSEKVFKTALILQALISLVFFIGSLNAWYGLIATMIFLFGILLNIGLAVPNASALALAPFSRNAGSASALLGFLEIGLGSLATTGIGVLNFKGSLPTATVMAVSVIIGLGVLLAGKKRIIRTEKPAGKIVEIA
ncbi:MAG TPA: multidrug effflux MFS transporter [Chitinophagaceae bacterium]